MPPFNDFRLGEYLFEKSLDVHFPFFYSLLGVISEPPTCSDPLFYLDRWKLGFD